LGDLPFAQPIVKTRLLISRLIGKFWTDSCFEDEQSGEDAECDVVLLDNVQ
jgi:hypothetical protein